MPSLLLLPAAICLFWLIPGTPAAADSQCADICQLGEVSEDGICALWDSNKRLWMDQIDDGDGELHNRARVHLAWLRERLMPAGGVMSAVFSDETYQEVRSFNGVRDPAIWTGAYLAAEALRFLTTAAPDAEAQMAKTLRVLHRWWNLPGDPGYLARFAAPEDSAPAILAALPLNDDEVHRDRASDGSLWRWRGDVSRDQYQGVMLGYSLAYEATQDDALRELIREDVVEFAEQLMRRERHTVAVIVNGRRTELRVDLENVIYSQSEMLDATPTVEIDLATQEVKGRGILVFWPNPSEYLRQIPGLGWLPRIQLNTQAIQLASIFRVALQVTDGVPGYAARRQTLAEYYDRRFDEWLDIASNWENTESCGDSYYGLNIAFMPIFNWARLESDPQRQERIKREVLADRMWPAVAEHKNVFFAFVYASQAPVGTAVDSVVSRHVEQLAGFPPAPNEAIPVDLRDLYQEDASCPGQSVDAIDVGQRVPATFIWERKAWKLSDPGVPNLLYSGVDYLLAYWMSRYFVYVEEDAPGTCSAYRNSEIGLWSPRTAAQIDSDWDFVDADSGLLDAVVIAGSPTYNGWDPGVVRLRNVSDLGFEARFQEWDYRGRDFGDGQHVAESLPFVVLTPGRYVRSDGSVWEVGRFDLGGTLNWQTVRFAEAFAGAPNLFLTGQTSWGSQAVIARARHVRADGFEVALLEEEALNDGHAIETIGYLAIHSPEGGGLIDLDGVEVPYLLQTVAADHRWLPALSHRLRLEEEQSRDTETNHLDELISVLALGTQIFAQQITHNGPDTAALRRLAPTTAAPMEWGMLRGIDHNWQTLPFAKSYADPVVIAKPTTNNGGDAGVIRISGVQSGHARLRYQEWAGYLDGWHTGEDVFYLVADAGQHRLGQLAVQADWVDTNRLAQAGRWEAIDFDTFFVTDPVVLSAVMTSNGSDPVTTRIRGLDPGGFQLAMDEQESKADGHVDEKVGWVAIEGGDAITAEGRRLSVFFTSIDDNLTPVRFTIPTLHRYPSVIGDIDSTYGIDPVFLRFADLIRDEVKLKLSEEQSADTETNHLFEDVGVFVGE
ncbi:MAG: hypothetical protein WBG92_25855 [Thiohalocapsa sp.]